MFRYDPADPFAVTVVHYQDSGAQWWTFGRDLLASGLLGPTGEGDVKISPCADPHLVRFEFTSAGTRLTLHTSAVSIRTFLRKAFAAVPAGSEGEWIDIDAELANLIR